MDASIPCPDCGRVTRLPEIHPGRRFKCPGCGAIVSPKSKIGPAPASQGNTVDEFCVFQRDLKPEEVQALVGR